MHTLLSVAYHQNHSKQIANCIVTKLYISETFLFHVSFAGYIKHDK